MLVISSSNRSLAKFKKRRLPPSITGPLASQNSSQVRLVEEKKRKTVDPQQTDIKEGVRETGPSDIKNTLDSSSPSRSPTKIKRRRLSPSTTGPPAYQSSKPVQYIEENKAEQVTYQLSEPRSISASSITPSDFIPTPPSYSPTSYSPAIPMCSYYCCSQIHAYHASNNATPGYISSYNPTFSSYNLISPSYGPVSPSYDPSLTYPESPSSYSMAPSWYNPTCPAFPSHSPSSLSYSPPTPKSPSSPPNYSPTTPSYSHLPHSYKTPAAPSYYPTAPTYNPPLPAYSPPPTYSPPSPHSAPPPPPTHSPPTVSQAILSSSIFVESYLADGSTSPTRGSIFLDYVPLALSSTPRPGSPTKYVPVKCGVCFEMIHKDKRTSRLSQSLGGEHFQREVCGHLRKYCCECVQKYVEGKIYDGRHIIKCPEPECTAVLFDADVFQLVSNPAYNKWRANKKKDYKSRAMNIATDPTGLFDALRETWTIPCPSCSVLVSRSSGCESMQCTCGHRFCYKCGKSSEPEETGNYEGHHDCDCDSGSGPNDDAKHRFERIWKQFRERHGMQINKLVPISNKSKQEKHEEDSDEASLENFQSEALCKELQTADTLVQLAHSSSTGQSLLV